MENLNKSFKALSKTPILAAHTLFFISITFIGILRLKFAKNKHNAKHSSKLVKVKMKMSQNLTPIRTMFWINLSKAYDYLKGTNFRGN